MQDLNVSDEVYICPTIIQEILQGIKSDNQYEIVKNSLEGVRRLVLDPYVVAVDAAELYRSLRREGTTIRKSNDCLIAYYGIHFQIPGWHQDRDFDHIAEYSPLKIFRQS